MSSSLYHCTQLQGTLSGFVSELSDHTDEAGRVVMDVLLGLWPQTTYPPPMNSLRIFSVHPTGPPHTLELVGTDDDTKPVSPMALE